jgi:hypothetical protein
MLNVVAPTQVVQFSGNLMALPVTIRLGYNGLTETNALAYLTVLARKRGNVF